MYEITQSHVEMSCGSRHWRRPIDSIGEIEVSKSHGRYWSVLLWPAVHADGRTRFDCLAYLKNERFMPYAAENGASSRVPLPFVLRDLDDPDSVVEAINNARDHRPT
jgi:hypothetical protein